MYCKTRKYILKVEYCKKISAAQLDKLCNLACSRNAEIRSKVASLLVDRYSLRSETVLYHLTFDKDDIVKLEAVDSLCIGKTEMSLQRLKKLCRDDDYYVRYFAIQSYYDVYVRIHGRAMEAKQSLATCLQKLLIEEEAGLARLAIYKGLFLCGNSDALENIVSLLADAIKKNDNSIISPALNILRETTDNLPNDVREQLDYIWEKYEKRSC